jgi:hypothetical protein
MLAPLLRLSCLLALAVTATAQSIVVPNANANARGVGGLNTLTRNAGNPRTYMLGIPASELTGIPVGSVINGVSFRSNFGSNPSTWPPSDTTWTDYEVTVGNTIPIATWTGTFLSNFTNTPIPPVMVRDGGTLIETGSFTHNASIPPPQPNLPGEYYWDFQQTFPYTGGDLGILFTHPGSSQPTSAFFLDYVASSPGTGVAFSAATFQAASGTTASFCIVRIHYGYGRGCPGTAQMVPNLVLTNSVSGGGQAIFSIANSKASAPAAFLFGLNRTSIALPNGCTLLTAPMVQVPVMLSANGRSLLRLQIPAGLNGTVEAQSFVIDSGAPGGYAGSNGVTIKISP